MVDFHRLVFLAAILPLHPEHFRLALQAVLSSPVPMPAPSAEPSGNTTMLILIGSFISQIKVNGIVSTVIQAIKKMPGPLFSWISTRTPGVTRTVAAVAAVLTSAGIHWTFSGSVLTVTGLTLTGIVTFLYGAGQNYLFQHAWFKLLFSSAPPETGTTLVAIPPAVAQGMMSAAPIVAK